MKKKGTTSAARALEKKRRNPANSDTCFGYTWLHYRSIIGGDPDITRICEENLKGRYDLQIIDIYQQPSLAAGEQIIAAPTLIKKLPLPLRRFIGNMANNDKILVGLDLRPKK